MRATKLTIRRAVPALLVALLGASSARSGEPAPEGAWAVALETDGGSVEFGLEVRRGPEGLEAWLLNGSERTPVPRVTWRPPELLLEFEHYGSALRTTRSEDGTTLKGEWTRRLAALPELTAALRAVAASDAPGVEPGEEAPRTAELADRWRVHFADRDGPAVGIFRSAPGGTVEGTFLTSDGDLGHLAGSFEAGWLRLDAFDGLRPVLATARLDGDGVLEGDLWIAESHTTWFAEPDPEAAIRDPYEQVDWSPDTPLRLDARVLHDLDGDPRCIADVVAPGAPLVIEVLGTWCPSCHEASRHLAALRRRYAGRGVAFVGLAFEFAEDLAGARALVRGYAERHGIEYSLLIATPDGSRLPSEVLEGVDGIFAFPTLVFVRADGRPLAVYSGYSGAATGDDHERLGRELETLIERLLEDE